MEESLYNTQKIFNHLNPLRCAPHVIPVRRIIVSIYTDLTIIRRCYICHLQIVLVFWKAKYIDKDICICLTIEKYIPLEFTKKGKMFK